MSATSGEGIWEILSDLKMKTTTSELPETAVMIEYLSKGDCHILPKVFCLWPSFLQSEWEGQLPVIFALTFLHSTSWFCHALLFSSTMWENELKCNQVLLVIMWVFPVTLMHVGLEPLEQNFHIETAMWVRKMSVGDSSSVNETWFLTTQTQTWYLRDISVWPCAFRGWGWNPDSR